MTMRLRSMDAAEVVAKVEAKIETEAEVEHGIWEVAF